MGLAAFQVELYDVNVVKDKGGAIYGKANIRGKEKIFYSTYLPISSNRRTIMLFTDDGDKIRSSPLIDHISRRKEAP